MLVSVLLISIKLNVRLSEVPNRRSCRNGHRQRESQERSNESADQLDQVIHMLPDERAVHSQACDSGAQGM
jgi:hypothetical protein